MVGESSDEAVVHQRNAVPLSAMIAQLIPIPTCSRSVFLKNTSHW